MEILYTVWVFAKVIAAVLLLFGAAVFVHEFGHFWVARRLGMKVEAFAIGFGPKIFSWTRDGIEYSWRWIPAGGFVKLPQMISSELLEGSSEGEQIAPASPWTRILVAFAGPFMNVVFAFVIATLIYFTGLPVVVDPPIVGAVDVESREGQLGIIAGDLVVEVDGEEVKTWQEVTIQTVLARTNMIPVVFERDGVRHEYVLQARVNDHFEWKILNLNPSGHPGIMEVIAGAAASEAGLEPGDLVLFFAGMPISSQTQLIELIQKNGADTAEIEVQRAEQVLSFSVTPRIDSASGRAMIGVMLGTNSAQIYEVKKPGPSPFAQIAEVWKKTVQTLGALVHSKQTGVGVKDLSGPPGILAMLAREVLTDFRLALSFLVLLNVNLAIINLLPIPLLDGGHIVMALIEKLARRPLSVRLVEYTTAFFALLLISFMLYVSFNDVKRWSRFKSMFQVETEVQERRGTGNSEVAP